jgi:hypothetical protein
MAEELRLGVFKALVKVAVMSSSPVLKHLHYDVFNLSYQMEGALRSLCRNGFLGSPSSYE